MTPDSPLPEIVAGLYDIGASSAPATGSGSPPAATYAYFLTAGAVSPSVAPTLRDAWSDPALIGWFVFLAAPVTDGPAFVTAARAALPGLSSTSQQNLRAIVWLSAPDSLATYESLVFYQWSPPQDMRTTSQPPYAFTWGPLTLTLGQGVSIGFDFDALAFTVTTDAQDTGNITLTGIGSNPYWYSTNPYTWTLTIPLLDDGAGAFCTAFGLDLGLVTQQFGCCLRYVEASSGSALGLDYPFYPPAAPGASIPGFAIQLHPLFPTDPSWTRLALDFGDSTPNVYQLATRGLQASYFLTTTGGAITVAPVQAGAGNGDEAVLRSGFAFCTGPAPGSPSLSPPSSQLYLAPVGPHQIMSVARPTGSPEQPGLTAQWMCGLSALEYVEIADGDVIELLSPMPAFLPAAAPLGSSGLDPRFTTSWVRFPATGVVARRYFGQPGASVYYTAAAPGNCAPPVDALLATLTVPTIFPVAPYGGVTIGAATPASAFSRLESRALSGERHQRATAASDGPVFLPPAFSARNSHLADVAATGIPTAVTPQGFVVQLNASAMAGTWSSIEFARSPEDGTQFLSLAGAGSPPVVGTDISTLLMQNELFLVVSDATRLGTFANELTLAGFNFLLDVGSGNGPVGANSTILIFKYNTTTSLVDLAGRTDLWAGVSGFVHDLPGTQRQIALAIEAAQTPPAGGGDGFSRRFSATGAGGTSPPDTDPFANFRAIAESPDWTGVLALNCAIDGSGMPLDLQMLLGGINGELRAHHFGIQSNLLAYVAGAAAIDQSSLFGVIAYPSLTQPAPPVDTTDDFDYELELLTVAFSNSKITDFKVRVGLTINRLFGRAVELTGGGDHLSPTSPANTLQIPGRYQLQDGIATVTFSTSQPFFYTFPVPEGTSRVLEQIVFDHASLVPVSSNAYDSPVSGSPVVTQVTARFDLGGALWFSRSPFQVAPGLDLFSYGLDRDAIASGLPLDNLSVNLAFTLDAAGGIVGTRRVTGDLSRLTLTSSSSVTRSGSLLYSLPLQLSKFLYAQAGFTAASLGASPVHVLQLEGSHPPVMSPLISPVVSPLLPATTPAPNVTTAPQYGLEFDMPLGSLGALSDVSVGLMAKLIIAWGASRVVPDSDAAAVLVQLPQVFAGYGSFQLQGILKTTFGDANLLMVELDEGPVYALMFNNIQLSVLGYGFPPGIVIDFLLFAGERGSSSGGEKQNLAWFLGAFQPLVSPPGAA